MVPDQPNALALRGLALGRLGQGDEAIERLRRAVHLKPALPDAWRALGDHYTALEMREAADGAYAQSIRHSTHDPKLMGAALALAENRIPEAEGALREHLKRHPTDVAAIRMLAEVAARHRALSSMRKTCCHVASNSLRDSAAARHNYAMVLHRQNKPEAALAQVERLLARRPAQSRLSQSQGRDPWAHRRVRGVHRALPERARGLSEPGQGVDEPGARAQDRRQQRRKHRRLSQDASSARRNSARRTGASRTSRRFRFIAGADAGHARAARGHRAVRRRPLSFRVLAGQGARRRGRVRRVVRALPSRATACAGR